MKTSNKDLMNNSAKKKFDGMEFHEPLLYEDGGLMSEIAMEIGLDPHEIQRLKKQMERS